MKLSMVFIYPTDEQSNFTEKKKNNLMFFIITGCQRTSWGLYVLDSIHIYNFIIFLNFKNSTFLIIL